MFYTYSTNMQESRLRDFGPYRIFITGANFPIINSPQSTEYEFISIIPKIIYNENVLEESEQIEEKIKRIASRVPEEKWAAIPKDFNENLDDYLYK